MLLDPEVWPLTRALLEAWHDVEIEIIPIFYGMQRFGVLVETSVQAQQN